MVTDCYRGLLGWALGHRAILVGGSVFMLGAAVASVPWLGTEFMPQLDEGSLLIETRRLPVPPCHRVWRLLRISNARSLHCRKFGAS